MGLLACAVVSTARWLGTGWISESFAGLPVGIWLVGATVGVTWWMERRERSSTSEEEGREPAGLLAVAGMVREGMKMSVGEAARRFMSHPIYSGSQRKNDGGEREGDRAEARSERIDWGLRNNGTPRIGVGGPEELAEAFVEQVREEGVAGARYELVSSPVRDPEECAKRGLSGAVTFSKSGQAAIVLPEMRGREAAWEDWSQRLALSYPAVFPPRVDAGRIACGPVRVRSTREARLVARMAEAASLLAQTEARTGVRRSAEEAAAQRTRTERAMELLARTFCADWSEEDERKVASPACRAAARGVGAWLSTWEGQIDPQERRRWLSVCASFIEDEPEAHLRLAAAQIGAYEDDQALPALRRAFELLRESGEQPMSDPLAFVLAEMELGNFSSLALGRVAAGLAIAWATTPRESLAYLRDDLIDDLEHSGKLLGRDQDHALLKRIMTQMDRLRSDTLPMRVKAA
jgi:hypothetical protein